MFVLPGPGLVDRFALLPASRLRHTPHASKHMADQGKVHGYTSSHTPRHGARQEPASLPPFTSGNTTADTRAALSGLGL